ncbi:MAG TPA: ATP-binding protein [Candidatus Binataceae bacterium]|nr:ATP-binding protein [Candidatus Binataceae bacterium]
MSDQQREWFRRLIESTGDPVSIVSARSGRFVDLNSAFERFTGMRPAELIGRTPAEVSLLNDLGPYDELLRSPQQRSCAPIAFQISGEATRLVEPTAMTIEVGAQPCLMIVWRDVTNQKEIEQELARARDFAVQSSQLKSQFIANMSHEIRTPLTGIISVVQLMGTTELTADQRDLTETIAASSRTLLKLVNNVLDFSKISSDQLRMEQEVFDLRELIERSFALFRSEAKRKQIELAAIVDSAVPSSLRGDPERLGQVLNNLLNNALKFTEHGHINLKVDLKEGSGNLLALRFEVSDTGIGIRPQDQSRLFQPFAQADESTTRRFGGTGLGLAICAKLVELMQGEIGVVSVPNRGSSFYFTIKLMRAQASDASAGSAHDAQPSMRFTPRPDNHQNERLLVVDDNVVNRQIIQRQLQVLGYKDVEMACDGEQAVEKAIHSEYGLILMDCQMPGVDGFEAASTIRSRERSAQHAVIIGITASPSDETRERCIASGMDGFIAKPVNLEELEATFSRLYLDSKMQEFTPAKAAH